MKRKDELIEEKNREIEKYRNILNRYHGRWWDQGKRYLEKLTKELEELENVKEFEK